MAAPGAAGGRKQAQSTVLVTVLVVVMAGHGWAEANGTEAPAAGQIASAWDSGANSGQTTGVQSGNEAEALQYMMHLLRAQTTREASLALAKAQVDHALAAHVAAEIVYKAAVRNASMLATTIETAQGVTEQAQYAVSDAQSQVDLFSMITTLNPSNIAFTQEEIPIQAENTTCSNGTELKLPFPPVILNIPQTQILFSRCLGWPCSQLSCCMQFQTVCTSENPDQGCLMLGQELPSTCPPILNSAALRYLSDQVVVAKAVLTANQGLVNATVRSHMLAIETREEASDAADAADDVIQSAIALQEMVEKDIFYQTTAATPAASTSPTRRDVDELEGEQQPLASSTAADSGTITATLGLVATVLVLQLISLLGMCVYARRVSVGPAAAGRVSIDRKPTKRHQSDTQL